MQEKSAGVVVVNDHKFLLLHYDAGHWDFPKGHVEKGETDEQTALRELKEETGISEVEILPGFSHGIRYFFRKEGKLVSKDVLFFVARTKIKNVELSFEHKDFIWLPFQEALDKLTYPTSKEVLKRAEEFLHGKK
ncbi:NUDIX domain-containing protein [Candidatus Woesearchaeota archaeon]|nr:NUDIX domain-containing protein [Candidatus Woesearchaeota archaeon]MBW3016665.1 NUDIX domain-containing protein [Candidatus Woesearchaeota archaeon]